jgi:hypothetical protein
MGERTALFWIALTMAAGAVAAADDSPVAKIIDVTLSDAQQQVAAVRGQLQPGGRYQFVLDRDRLRLDQMLTEIGELLARRASAAELTPGDKVALLHAEEVANAILTQNDSERLACEDSSEGPQVRCLWPDLHRTDSTRRREPADGKMSKLSLQTAG